MSEPQKFYEAEIPIEPIGKAKISPADFAEWLAYQDDFTQARFFEAFNTHLSIACTGEGRCRAMQLHQIGLNLDSDTRYSLNDMANAKGEI